MKVYVYYNLHKKCWSIKALEGAQKGRVIDHEEYVWLKNATPRVSEAGRQRVLKERRKNVHAGIVGEWCRGECHDSDLLTGEVTYNPYKYNSFVFKEDERTFNGSPDVVMWSGRVWAFGENC